MPSGSSSSAFGVRSTATTREPGSCEQCRRGTAKLARTDHQGRVRRAAEIVEIVRAAGGEMVSLHPL
jgi:hypothetical protein